MDTQVYKPQPSHVNTSSSAHVHAKIPYTDNRPEFSAHNALQTMANNAVQTKRLAGLQQIADARSIQSKENKLGSPNNDVVHKNAHIVQREQKHTPHEAWHVIQQKQENILDLEAKTNLPENKSTTLQKKLKKTGTGSANDKRTKQLQAVIQLQCDHCTNMACDDGSICDYDGRSYGIGQHGARRGEQRRLTDQYGSAVSGDTHQSEHYFGFAVLNQTSGQSRRESGRFEREAHAYQEVHDSHRGHVGTGSSNTVGPSGFSADTYRDDQRSLLESRDVSSAGQLNSLGYAFTPGFHTGAQTIGGQQASDSFTAMMGQMDQVTYLQGNTPVNVPVSNIDRLEQLAARFTAVNRRYPTETELDDMRRQLGILW